MRMVKPLSAIALIFVLALSLGPGAGRLYGQQPQTGFPSLDTSDGKFVALAGSGLSTVAQPVSFWIGLPAEQGSFTLDIFDGDLGGFWDVHDTASTVKVNYVLYADPLKNGQGTTVVASKSSADFGDDAWGALYDGSVHSAARSPGGNHFYRLSVSFSDASASSNELNGFKVRVNGQVGIIPGTFGFVGAPINVDVLTGKADPAPGTARNQNNGDWHWYVYAPSAGTAVTLADTDADSRTSLTRPGNPPDDCSPGATCFAIAPDIRYRVLDAAGNSLITVTVPSGDLETVSRTLTAGQAGFLDWNWTGVDGHNLVFISSSHEIFASSAQAPLAVGTATIDPAPSQSTIKGRLYADGNCNGVAEAGEGGLEGVRVTIDSGGGWSARTTSGPDGQYEFAGLSEGKFNLSPAIPAGYARAVPASREGVAVDGHVQTIVGGADFGMATQSGCAAASETVSSQPSAPIPWPPQGPNRAWYLAEGCACEPFETRFIVTNPGDTPASLAATFMKEDGTALERRYDLPARSPLDLAPDQALAGAAFATRIEADQPVFVQRFMSIGQEARLAPAANAPGRTWYLAEGRTGGGFDTWLLIMNPGLAPARATITFFREDGPPIERTYDLLPTSRLSLYVNSVLPEAAFGARVEADQPIVVERSVYFSGGQGQVAMGSTSLSKTWYAVDGAGGSGAGIRLVVMNSNTSSMEATVTGVKEDGSMQERSISLGPSSRGSVLSSEIGSGPFSFITVRSSLPVVVERTGFWDGADSAFTSPAVAGTSRAWTFPTGKVAPFRRALLVANPSNTATTLSGTFLLEGGEAVTRYYALAANARLVLDGGAIPERALWVDLNSDLPVVAERAMQSSSGR